MMIPDTVLYHVEQFDKNLQTALPLLEYLRRTSESGLRDLFAALTSLRASVAHLEARERRRLMATGVPSDKDLHGELNHHQPQAMFKLVMTSLRQLQKA